MTDLAFSKDGDQLTIAFAGHIDATRAADVEEAARAIVEREGCNELVIDCTDLSFLSSAGIRIVLRLAKMVPLLKLVNVPTDVYEVLDMTGLTEMIEVSKIYRTISVEGCPVIGYGANGVVYRIDPETICKVPRNAQSLPDIDRERKLSRAAFVAGIPTAIPYDVVRVGDGFGTVFELLNATSMADLLIQGDYSLEDVAKESVELLKQMADSSLDPATIPSVKEDALTWIDDIHGEIDPDVENRLRELFEAVPETDRMVHGDFHIKNFRVQNGEPLLIDLDTLSHGDPVFDLATTYSAYVGYGAVSPKKIDDFLGISHVETAKLWDLILHGYLAGRSKEEIAAAEDRIRLVSAVRLMGQPKRHGKLGTADGDKVIATYRRIIEETLPRVNHIAL